MRAFSNVMRAMAGPRPPSAPRRHAHHLLYAHACAPAQQTVALSGPGPLQPAGRLAGPGLAHAGRTVGGSGRVSGLASAGGLRAGHGADAQRRLLHQRHRRPRFRPPRQAHHPAPHHLGAGLGQGGRAAGRGPGPGLAGPGADHALGGRGLVRARRAVHHPLPVHQALLRHAPGLPGHCLQLRHRHRLRRRAGPGAGHGLD